MSLQAIMCCEVHTHLLSLIKSTLPMTKQRVRTWAAASVGAADSPAAAAAAASLWILRK